MLYQPSLIKPTIFTPKFLSSFFCTQESQTHLIFTWSWKTMQVKGGICHAQLKLKMFFKITNTHAPELLKVVVLVYRELD